MQTGRVNSLSKGSKVCPKARFLKPPSFVSQPMLSCTHSIAGNVSVGLNSVANMNCCCSQLPAAHGRGLLGDLDGVCHQWCALMKDVVV